MKIIHSVLFTGILIPLILVAGCAGRDTSDQATDYNSFIDSLRDAGANVEPAGEIIQDFFSVRGQLIKVNGEDIQVFEYSNQAIAEEEAALVSLDGSSIGTSMPFWIAPPHFYKAGRVIVLYLGENIAITDMLRDILGSQFAGR